VAVTRTLIDVAANVKISKDMIEDKDAEEGAPRVLNSSPTKLEHTLKQNVNRVMQRVLDLEDSRRNLQN
jgi:hypothetical protein